MKIPLVMSAIFSCGLLMAEDHKSEITVEVHPQSVGYNGYTEVSMGMLGVHNVPLSEQRVADWGVTGVRRIHHNPGGVTRIPGPEARAALQKRFEAAEGKDRRRLKRQLDGMLPHTVQWAMDCFYDRYQPALQVTNPNGWEAKLRESVRNFVSNARKSGQQHYLEFWNEPYLNWATNPAVNYSPRYYETAGISEGDPMVRRGTKEPVAGLKWGPKRFWVKERGSINYVVSGYIPPNAKPGQKTRLRFGAGTVVLNVGGKVKIRGKEWELGYGHWGRDTGQKHYWAGPVSVAYYNEMLAVVGDEMQKLKADGEIPLAGGWGFNIFNEGWDSWHRLIKPTIDATHEYIDAIHEHHYGGDVRLVGSSYEVAYNYAQATYGRRLQFWNTEAGGHLDPQQPGNTKPHNTGDPLTKARAAMTYLLRDVIYQWAHVPDKAIFRAAHHSHHNGGDQWAFRMLKNQGGTLLRVEDNDPRLWAVATTDSEQSEVMLFNDGRQSKQVRIKLPMANGPVEISQVLTIDGKLQIVSKQANITNHNLVVSVDPVSAVRLSLPKVKVTSDTQWTQFCSADVLIDFSKPVTTNISIPQDELAKSQAAKIRLVISSAHDKVMVTIAGVQQEIGPVPVGVSDHTLTPEQQAALTSRTDITLSANAGKGQVYSLSLWLSADQW